MTLLDRLLAHDAYSTRQLLDLSADLSDAQLDRQFDVGHRSLRATFHHLIRNMEIWSALMADQRAGRPPGHSLPDNAEKQTRTDQTVPAFTRRLDAAAARLASVAHDIKDNNAWDDLWTDHLDDPPRQKTYGAAIAHVITHSHHHRAQLLYLLRLSGVSPLPEGDVFSWENKHGVD